MRKLPLCLILAFLALFAVAAPAQALALPDVLGGPAEPADEEASDPEDGEEGEAEEDGCAIEDEEDVQLCAEIAEEERESREAEKCVLESANASVNVNPSGKVRLTIHYTNYGPASFALSYSLRGSKGALRLGGAEARFGRTGTYRDVVRVDERRLPKLLSAREFQIELRAEKTPGSCRERLTVRAPHRSSRPHPRRRAS